MTVQRHNYGNVNCNYIPEMVQNRDVTTNGNNKLSNSAILMTLSAF